MYQASGSRPPRGFLWRLWLVVGMLTVLVAALMLATAFAHGSDWQPDLEPNQAELDVS